MSSLYVSTLGNNTNAGTEAAPFLTIPAAITAASNGDTVYVMDGTYTHSGTITINKSLTLIGRADSSSGNRPVIDITTNPVGEGTALVCNASNIIIKGIQISDLGTAGSTDTCIGLAPGGTSIMNDSGIMVNENITIDDCRIVYSKFGVSSKAKSFNITNCVIHSRAVTTARAIAIYSQDGIVNITGNTYTSDGNLAIELLHNNFATNDGYQNKRNGTVNFTNNQTSGVIIGRRAIFFEAGCDTGLASDKYTLNVNNNTINTTSDSLLLLQPNRADFSNFINLITINNNTFNNPSSVSRNGLVRIGSFVSSATTPIVQTIHSINTINNPPKFKVYSNTITNATLALSTNPYNVDNKNLVILTGFTGGLPANIDSSLDATAPAPAVVTVSGEVIVIVDSTGTPITLDAIVASAPVPADLLSFNIEVKVDTEYVDAGENKPVVLADYSIEKTVVAALTIAALGSDGQPKTDFTANPIQLSLSIPNAVPGRNLKLYKIDPATKRILATQPAGFPKDLIYNSENGKWEAELTSLSTYIAVDPTFVYCVVEGTLIRTSRGDVAVEELSSGDLVLTADGRAVAADIFMTKMNYTTTENAPYHIPARTFGKYQSNALTVSPRHAVQVRPGVWEIPEFATKRYPQIKQIGCGKPVTYYHLRLPNYFTDNFVANGAVVESFAGDAVNALPAGTPLFKFNSKVGGFVRSSPLKQMSLKL